MPDSLEYVVRPYTARSPWGATIIPSTPLGSRERATITWGAEAEQPEVVEADGMAFNVVCCNETSTENSRTSETKRITQEGNADNWVDVRRPMTVKLQKKDKNKCIGTSQLSEAAQAVNASLDEFDAAVHSGTAAKKQKNCNQVWKFKSEPDSG